MQPRFKTSISMLLCRYPRVDLLALILLHFSFDLLGEPGVCGGAPHQIQCEQKLCLRSGLQAASTAQLHQLSTRRP